MKFFLLIAFAFLLSNTSKSDVIPSNGSDYIIVYTLNKYIKDESQLLKMVSSFKQSELELEDLSIELIKLGFSNTIKETGLIDALTNLEQNVTIVYERKKETKASIPILELIEKNNSELLSVSFLKKAKHIIDIETFINFSRNNTTGRYLVITKHDNAHNNFNIETEQLIPPKKVINLKSNVSFYEYIKNEFIEMPTLVNLGDVPSGGISIPIKIPIKNLGDLDFGIISITTPCQCIKELNYTNKIKSKNTEFIEFSIDTDYYLKDGIVDASIKILTSYMKSQTIELRILGTIDKDKNLIADPQRIFDQINKKDTLEKTYSIFLFGTKGTENYITHYSVNCDDELFEYKFKNSDNHSIGNYESCGSFEFTINPKLLNDKNNKGKIVISILYRDILRTYTIPYSILITPSN